MNRKRKRLIVGALVAVELLICVAIIAVLVANRAALGRVRFFYVADTHAEETIEESFATDGPSTLDLTNAHGEVQIMASNGDKIVVKVVKEVWGKDEREAEAKLQAIEVKMAMDGDTLRVEVEDPNVEISVISIGAYRGRSNEVRFEVVVPRQTTVVVHNRSGAITLEGTEGDADLTSRFGQIAVEDVSGSIAAGTNNGEVIVRRSGGEQAEVNLHSDFGDVTAQKVTARELTLDSNNGSLELEDVTVDGDLALSTLFGRIELESVRAESLKVTSQNGAITLKDAQFDGLLDMSTSFGAVSVARTGASEYRIETNNGAIELDGGHGPLWLHSSFGDIEVRGARDATLDLVTSNGKVTFEGSLSAEADHQVESNFGSVSLRLPSNTAVTLDASTDFGDIRCEFDVLVKGRSDDKERRTTGDELRGTINGGGVKLRVKTRNGDITIEAELFK